MKRQGGGAGAGKQGWPEAGGGAGAVKELQGVFAMAYQELQQWPSTLCLQKADCQCYHVLCSLRLQRLHFSMQSLMALCCWVLDAAD